MIRFIDITKGYFLDPRPDTMRLCIFVDTVSDTLVADSDGDLIFTSMDQVRTIHEGVRERCERLVPKGFFDERSL